MVRRMNVLNEEQSKRNEIRREEEEEKIEIIFKRISNHDHNVIKTNKETIFKKRKENASRALFLCSIGFFRYMDTKAIIINTLT
jgi:hypothetical protein